MCVSLSKGADVHLVKLAGEVSLMIAPWVQISPKGWLSLSDRLADPVMAQVKGWARVADADNGLKTLQRSYQNRGSLGRFEPREATAALCLGEKEGGRIAPKPRAESLASSAT
jgi:hypothetical protein